MRQLSEILRLKFAAGLSHAQIATALKLSRGMVSKSVSLAQGHYLAIDNPLPGQNRWPLILENDTLVSL